MIIDIPDRVIARVITQHGPIFDGMTVDHVCRNRRCVNVQHMRLLSNYENGRRTRGRDWPLGQCVNGHSNDYLRQYAQGRHCSICMRDTQRRYRERVRARS